MDAAERVSSSLASQLGRVSGPLFDLVMKARDPGSRCPRLTADELVLIPILIPLQELSITDGSSPNFPLREAPEEQKRSAPRKTGDHRL